MINKPQQIHLNNEENKFYQFVFSNFERPNDWKKVSDSMFSLFKSLIDRNAIPEIRKKIFADPEFAETGIKSPKQIFEKHCTKGDNIFRHHDFIKHLVYFINGPQLPKIVINKIFELAKEESFLDTPEISDNIRKYVRHSIREYDLDRNKVPKEFYKLAIEMGFSLTDSKAIRKEAMSVRKRQ